MPIDTSNTAMNPVNNNTADPNQPGNNKANQTRGTGFTNINEILDANKGAGQKMGEKIGSGLTQQADSVRAGIQASQNQFNVQKDQAGQKAQSAIQAGQNLTKQAGESDQAYAARVGQNKQGYNFSQIGSNLNSARYDGPNGLQDGSRLLSQSSTVGNEGMLANTGEGQNELLRTMVAAPGQYTRGQSALDQLLLGVGGQNAIQQGRQATLGLQQNAYDATAMAQQQAQALKSGIDTSRENTVHSLQDLVTGAGGIKDQGATQAKAFQSDATKLSQLLSGQWVPQSSEEKAQAAALVNNMNNFGLDDYKLYAKNDNSVRSALQNLGSTLTTNFGDRKYTDDQRLAGQNLADVLGDKSLHDEIANNKFNTNVFGKESDAFGQLDAKRNYDTESQNILKSLSTDLRSAEQKIEDQKNMLRGVQAQNASNPNTLNDMTANDFSKSLIDNMYANEFTDNRKVADGYSKYGFLGFGDQGENAIDDRFKGLGLNAETDRSGQYRSSAQVDQAAKKVLGPDAQLKDYILQKILGQNQTKDVNDGSFMPKMRG